MDTTGDEVSFVTKELKNTREEFDLVHIMIRQGRCPARIGGLLSHRDVLMHHNANGSGTVVERDEPSPPLFIYQ